MASISPKVTCPSITESEAELIANDAAALLAVLTAVYRAGYLTPELRFGRGNIFLPESLPAKRKLFRAFCTVADVKYTEAMVERLVVWEAPGEDWCREIEESIQAKYGLDMSPDTLQHMYVERLRRYLDARVQMSEIVENLFNELVVVNHDTFFEFYRRLGASQADVKALQARLFEPLPTSRLVPQLSLVMDSGALMKDGGSGRETLSDQELLWIRDLIDNQLSWRQSPVSPRSEEEEDSDSSEEVVSSEMRWRSLAFTRRPISVRTSHPGSPPRMAWPM